MTTKQRMDPGWVEMVAGQRFAGVGSFFFARMRKKQLMDPRWVEMAEKTSDAALMVTLVTQWINETQQYLLRHAETLEGRFPRFNAFIQDSQRVPRAMAPALPPTTARREPRAAAARRRGCCVSWRS